MEALKSCGKKLKGFGEKLLKEKMKSKAVYAGSFDPITFGHLDIIERALKLFDELIVLVARNPRKKPLFNVKERIKLVKETTKNLKKVRVEEFSGLLVDYMKKNEVKFIVRGLRALSDFDYEFQTALVNKKLNPGIETVFLITKPKFLYLSSSVVKEIVAFNGDISCFVPKKVEKALKQKLLKK
jgi:pantetheine-phosphate adenylyltransferase